MKSRVHPTYKTKYHVQNWAAYDRALVRRGDITIWVSPAAIPAWEPEGPSTRRAQRKYSDLAIHTALTLRLLFHLPLRQAEGFLASLFVLMGLDLRSPDHTTLFRRGHHLDCTLRRVPTRAGLHLIIDSTGLSIVGQGEWAAAKYGGRGTRGWRTSLRRLRPSSSPLPAAFLFLAFLVPPPSLSLEFHVGPDNRTKGSACALEVTDYGCAGWFLRNQRHCAMLNRRIRKIESRVAHPWTERGQRILIELVNLATEVGGVPAL